MRCEECPNSLTQDQIARHAKTCSPACSRARGNRLAREERHRRGRVEGAGSPSPAPSPVARSTAPSIASGQRHPPTPPPPNPDPPEPLPVNDPTAALGSAIGTVTTLLTAMGYEVTVLRTGTSAALRIRVREDDGKSPVRQVLDEIEGAGKHRGLDDFVADRLGGAR